MTHKLNSFEGITAPEAVACLGSMFFGQLETLMLISPCLGDLTRSELALALGAGFGSISGSVLFAYIAMGVSAFDLFTATIMAVPATIVISKLMEPEIYYSKFTEKSIKNALNKSHGDSILDALMQGAIRGGHVVIQVTLVLIVFYSILMLLDGIFAFLVSLVDETAQLGIEDLLGKLTL